MPTDKQTDSTSDQPPNRWTRGIIVLRENMLYNIQMISRFRPKNLHNINKDIWFNFIQFSCQSTKKRLVISLKGKFFLVYNESTTNTHDIKASMLSQHVHIHCIFHFIPPRCCSPVPLLLLLLHPRQTDHPLLHKTRWYDFWTQLFDKKKTLL